MWAEAPATIAPQHPAPGLKDLAEHSHRAFAYSSNVFVRDTGIPDIRELIQLGVPRVWLIPDL